MGSQVLPSSRSSKAAMLQTNQKMARPAASTSSPSTVQHPGILIAGNSIDAGLRGVIEGVCMRCGASVYSMEDALKSELPAGAKPCLIISLLPLGERRVPSEVANAVTTVLPGLPILLLCQEQLTRPSVSVEEGRVILIGQPFTEEKIAAHVRAIVENIPAIVSRPRTEQGVRKNTAKLVRNTNPSRSKNSFTWKTAALVLSILCFSGGVYLLLKIFSGRNSAPVTAETNKELKVNEGPKEEKKAVPVPAPIETLPAAPEIPSILTLEVAAGESMVLCLIPSGTFQMGSPTTEIGREDDEASPHAVSVERPFYISKFEVTQAEYAAVMGVNPSQFKDPRKPVETVSFFDAMDFCEKASARSGKPIRLPSEAEWEYACRAESTTPFSFGASLNDDQANVDGNDANRQRETVRVGSYAANAFGLFDMHGNVREWCRTNPDRSALQALRGGAWSSTARHARSAARHQYQPGGKNVDFGFRVVVDLPDVPGTRQTKSK